MKAALGCWRGKALLLLLPASVQVQEQMQAQVLVRVQAKARALHGRAKRCKEQSPGAGRRQTVRKQARDHNPCQQSRQSHLAMQRRCDAQLHEGCDP